MAELLLKVDAGSGYDDGDILCAFNRRAIRCCHAQHICHPKQARRNASGLIVVEDVLLDWYEVTHQFRFERVSATEVERVTIATGERERLGAKPNEKGEAIDVRLFVRRRKLKPTHRLFGEDGHEIWYGGRIDFGVDAVERVWDAIEGKTEHRRNAAEFVRWPMGRLDVRSHLPIAVDEFDDAEANELVSADIDDSDPENPVVLAKRKHGVDIERGLGLSVAEIAKARNKTEHFDLRGVRKFRRASIVNRKPKKGKL